MRHNLHIYRSPEAANHAQSLHVPTKGISTKFDCIVTKEDAYKHAGINFNCITYHDDYEDEIDKDVYAYMESRIRKISLV